jgi:small subunit ribosomal protein S1
MEAVQAGNSVETPAEEVAGIVETEGIEAALEEQAEGEEIEAEEIEVLVEGQADAEKIEAVLEGEAEAEAEEIEVLVEEQADAEETEVEFEEKAEAEEIEVSVEEQAGTVNGEVPSEEEDDSSQMGGIPVEDWDYQRPRRGEVRTGIILSIGEQEIIVDVGAKRDGIVPYADMQRMGEEALAELRVGSEVPVYVLRPEDQEGNLLISLFMARQQQAWIHAQALADSGDIWEGQVIGYNKGGLVIPLDEIRGFVPASQVPGFPHGLNQEERLTRLSSLVGETMPVKVIEINRRKRRLILSATAAQQDWRKQARTRLLKDLREGEVREGTVSSLCSFGAFVDLGGADGLVHLSELSWRRIRHPREAVSVGDKVEVYVLRLDHDRQRIGLSLKRLQPEPWALVEDKYELGQLVEGVVTNVVDFGAFAEVEEGVEGLIHVSELAEAAISHPRDVVKKGDLLLLRVIRIDTRRKRLGLSLKRVLESEWAEWAARLAAADIETAAARRAEEPADEPVAEMAEEAVEAEDASAEEPADALVAEVTEEPADELVAEVAEEAVEAADELADEAADAAVAEVTEEAAEESAVEEEETAQDPEPAVVQT